MSAIQRYRIKYVYIFTISIIGTWAFKDIVQIYTSFNSEW